MKCRHCNNPLQYVFADLAYSPISNAMLTQDKLQKSEEYFPLKVFVCDKCFLVQVDEIQEADKIFDSEYTYFSSFSTTWLKHTKNYVDLMMKKFNYNENSQVIEIASNDGCLLQNFLEYKVPVLGIDPTSNTAELAEKRGVKTLVEFFGAKLAQQKLVDQGIQADLLIGNNVLAHVPDINDFVKGMKIALKDTGVITMEFPHLMKLVEQNQFDTIYHEHFSYLSLNSVNTIFKNFGLEIFDVEELPTHGGSLRIYAKHQENNSISMSPKVESLIQTEIEAGMKDVNYYLGFQKKIEQIKYDALIFLIGEKRKGKKIIGYGAASKGNTFINYCGIKGTDIISFVVDASPFKQGKFLPGSHIPVLGKEKIKTVKPDFVIILPWNIKAEVIEHLSFIRDWGGKFVTFIPETKVF